MAYFLMIYSNHNIVRFTKIKIMPTTKKGQESSSHKGEDEKSKTSKSSEKGSKSSSNSGKGGKK